MTNDFEFRRAIEEIKLRTPIDELVGEVVELRPRGKLLWGCCPFHEERTPSFKVDPREGTWYCFGACRKGGDVIRFVQERSNVAFMDAMELLAARAGVELPRRKPRRTRENDPGIAALAFAERFFQEQLGGREGADARAYASSRGFGESAVSAFGLGWAPRSGGRLMDAARKEGIPAQAMIDSGLARRSEERGDLYSFFRGRLMIPIRDERGVTIAFGGRVVGDADGPKYVNTSETRYFHKGRVIYALDRAIDSVRRTGHIVLVEGYTDVIAAHVAGMPQVGAVLGTATTEMHAALVRKAGARRISLVFDGDDAGKQAAWRGLSGLLSLESRIEVVTLPDGVDPADVLGAEDGAAKFAARVETGIPWFDFVAECVAAKRSEGGRALAREVDRALELFQELPRPIEVDTAIVDLAKHLDIPVQTLRDQVKSMPARRRERASSGGRDAGGARSGGPSSGGPSSGGQGSGAQGSSRQGSHDQRPHGYGVPDRRGGSGSGAPARSGGAGAPSGPAPVQSGPGPGLGPVGSATNTPVPVLEPVARRAYEDLGGAALVDPALIPGLRPWIERCPDPVLSRIFQALVDLWENEDTEITVSLVMDALGGDPSRDRVPELHFRALDADDAAQLFKGAVQFLDQREHQGEFHRLQARIQALETQLSDDPAAAQELDNALMRLLELRRKPSE